MNNTKQIKSVINGTGIAAIRDFKKGDFIGFVEGPIKYKVNKVIDDSFGHPDWVGFKRNYWIDPLPPFKYINHSCEPNCGIAGTKKIHAIKNVKRDEELTFDYSISEIDTKWSLNCTCGTKTCRKKIYSIQSLTRKKINEYIPYIPSAFIKIYESEFKANLRKSKLGI